MVVCVRTRPLSEEEQGRGDGSVVHSFCEDKVVRIHKEARAGAVLRSEMGAQHEYAFDAVFGATATQEEVYEVTTKNLVMETLKGANSTVFAYGQTGSGKTHTMLGDAGKPGIIPLALVDLFKGIFSLEEEFIRTELPSLPEGSSKSWSIKLAYMEVYNETIYDLLTEKQRPLQPCEDPNDFQVKVLGLTEVEVTDVEQVLQLLETGNTRRRMESTAANKVSSRSHAVMQVKVESEILEPVPPSRMVRVAPKPRRTITSSVLSLIDLAGSERAASTQNRGARLREGANINKSLLALANAINALSGKKGTRVKYRDSKLTHLLKSSLEGNCRICMIAAINPSNKCYEESHNTLKYANRAKDIRLKAGAAAGNRQIISSGDMRMDELEAENQQLRSRLSIAFNMNATSPSDVEITDAFQTSTSPPRPPLPQQEQQQDRIQQLEAKVNALELQNHTLANVAAQKFQVAPTRLIEAVEKAAATALMTRDDELSKMQSLLSIRDQELQKLRNVVRMREKIEQDENRDVGVPIPPPHHRPSTKSSRRKSFIPTVNQMATKENEMRQPLGASLHAENVVKNQQQEKTKSSKKRLSSDGQGPARMKQKLDHHGEETLASSTSKRRMSRMRSARKPR